MALGGVAPLHRFSPRPERQWPPAHAVFRRIFALPGPDARLSLARGDKGRRHPCEGGVDRKCAATAFLTYFRLPNSLRTDHIPAVTF